MERKWKNIEFKPEMADKFRCFLKENGFKYEASGAYNLIHFEVYITETETNMINEWIDKEMCV